MSAINGYFGGETVSVRLGGLLGEGLARGSDFQCCAKKLADIQGSNRFLYMFASVREISGEGDP